MKKLLLLAVLGFLVSGCMSFNEKMLRVTDIPKQKDSTIIIETKSGNLDQQLNGVSGRGTVFSGTTVLNAVSKSMMARWKNKGVIKDFGVSGGLDKNPDFTLVLSGVTNEQGSMLLAVLTGLTLYVIPSNATLIYDLDVEFINNKTQQKYSVKVKNGITTWQQIVFLPFFAVSWVGSYNALCDMSDYLYDELNKQGALNS